MGGLLVGCDGVFDEPDALSGAEAPCSSIEDCEEDELCETGVCVDVSCRSDACEQEQDCYRGTCVAHCSTPGECSESERCWDETCLALDCSDATCDDAEQCYFGVCRPACDSDQDCLDEAGESGAEEGKPICHRGACVASPCEDTDALPDGRPCPDTNLVTIGVTDVSSQAATFEAAVFDQSERQLSDHGFCWSQSSEPTIDDECVSLGAVEQRGMFSTRVEQLSPGRSYYVRAYFTVDDGTDERILYAEDSRAVSFTTATPKVTGVEASRGDYWNRVELHWQELDDVIGYRIYRDGQPVDEIAEGAKSWTDEDVERLEKPPAPANLSATEVLSEYVRLSWDAVQISTSPRYNYSVAALYPDAQSEPSEVVEGYGSSPVLVGYGIYRNEDLIDIVETTQFMDDEEAMVGRAEAPELTATGGAYTDRVSLSWNAPEVRAGDMHSYEVTTVYEVGGQRTHSLAAGPVEGRRAGAPVVGYQLEVDGEWRDVGGHTEYDDWTADEPTIEPGVVTATEGEYLDRVSLQLQGASRRAGDKSTYRVRAITEGGKQGEISEKRQGYIGVGELEFQWQRSISDSAANFFDLQGATEKSHIDETAPENGDQRYYRVVVGAEGAENEITSAEVGSRAAAPFSYHADGSTLRKLDRNGNEYWSREVVTGSSIANSSRYVQVDDEGYVYAVGDAEIIKLDEDGNEIQSFSGFDRTPSHIAIDDEGNLFTASESIRKFDSSGEQIWVYEDNFANTDIWPTVVVDPAGDVYAGGATDLVKLDGGSGGEIRTISDAYGWNMAVDQQGAVYAPSSTDGKLAKFGADGDFRWEVDTEDWIVAVAVDGDGGVYVADEQHYLYKFDSAGEHIWTWDDRPAVHIGVDPEGDVLTSTDGEVRQFDADGEERWKLELESTPAGMAVDPGVPGVFSDAWDGWND